MGTRLETARLVIRTFQDSDAAPWTEMLGDPEVGRYLPPFSPPSIAQFGGVLAARHAEENDCGYAIWAVQDKVTGAFLGQCGLRLISQDTDPETEIAYHYVRSAWNKGYGTEAAIAVLAHGLGPVGLDRIIAVVMPENTGSWRVMEKAGMRYEGTADYFGLTGLKKYAAERTWWGSCR